MKILVINGDCLQVNSSANLCHLAYLRGFLEAGHEVTLLSADGRDYVLDPAMKIPAEVKCISFYSVSLYEKMSLRKRAAAQAADGQAGASSEATPSFKQKTLGKLKYLVLSLYGAHGINAPFVRKAKRFSAEKEFDYVISLSHPPASHLLAYKLLSSGHVRSHHWIQIWEDPWYSDAYGINRKASVFRGEKRLLSVAERICYVSPLTLENQKKLFPESAHKMFWQPLPSYYTPSAGADGKADRQLFGYFGAYSPEARNLAPFYEAAKETGIRVNICGEPSNLFQATDNIRIYPRLPLNELRPFEEETGVLVFLCNRAGGQIPGKLYQYAATDKTILFILDGSEEEKQVLRDYFTPYQRFVFCENDAEDIAISIRKICAGELGEVKNRRLTEFEPKKIVRKILEEGAQ